MTRILLAAGVAALAITAPAASAAQDRGGGKDRRAQAAKSQKAERGGQTRAQRVERRAERPQRAQRVERRAERPQRAQRLEQRAERPQRAQRIEARAERPQRIERAARAPIIERRADAQGIERRNRRIAQVAERRGVRLEQGAARRDAQLVRLADRNVLRTEDWKDLARGGIWLDGCPPGLMKAKRIEPCVPPGQVKYILGKPVSTISKQLSLNPLPDRLRSVYADTDDYYYRYGNGYAYRIDRDNDLISALLPLFGLGLTSGQMFPTNYSNYYMPTGLQSFYPNSPYTSYRYANGYVYEVDPFTGMIEDVDPLLGYGYGYGQMMPISYSAYNVPYQYRSLYYDTPDYSYRYAPGAIYQVDPTTSLITAVAALLSGGMTIGQQMPMGFSAYNVPYQYRTTYYDTPDAWYRYSNGNIYQIDPTTQLVTALVASILT